jgi:glucose-1-phosphate thymidylyltransferase
MTFDRLNDAPPVGIVLAGGRGTRLAPLTDTLPKQLAPAGPMPVLGRIVTQLVAAGVREVVVVLGDRGERVRAAIGDGAAFGATVRYVQQPAPAGIGDAVRRTGAIVAGRTCCVVLGDVVYAHPLAREIAAMRARGDAARLLVAAVPDATGYGVVETDADGRVARVVEKPRDYGAGLAIAGVYLFDPRIFTALADLPPSARGEIELTDAIARLIAGGAPVSAALIEGAWVDTGTLAGVLAGNAAALAEVAGTCAGAVDAASSVAPGCEIAAGARVRRSVLRGGVAIGPGAMIEDCDLGPNVTVGAGCLLRGVRAHDALILDGAQVAAERIVLARTVIGGGSRVGASLSDAIVGEHAQIGGDDGL